MEEIWLDIVGYEGRYQVSNYGRVKSLNYKCTGKEKILKLVNNRDGYLRICLCKDGKVKCYKVHRLVLKTFNPVENMEQLEVDHIDTNPSNNNLENLRWTTRKENCNNPLTRKHGSESKKGKYTGENNPMYGKHGAKNPRSIPIVQLTLEGDLVEVYESAKEAEKSGFNNVCINQCIKGKRNKHSGYKWEYLYKYLLLKNPKVMEINLFGKTYKREECKNA